VSADGRLDDPLEEMDQLQDQLDALPAICRYQYTRVSNIQFGIDLVRNVRSPVFVVLCLFSLRLVYLQAGEVLLSLMDPFIQEYRTLLQKLPLELTSEMEKAVRIAEGI
jgi:hypothetical protein